MNYQRGPTGIGMGVNRIGGQNYGHGPNKSPRFNNNQYDMDHDDDYEDDDFGDVDEHQENDINHHKNTEARDELNMIESKMM